jgi:hypothetical protein
MLVKSEKYVYDSLYDFIDDDNFQFFAKKIGFNKKYKDLTNNEIIEFTDKIIFSYESDQGAIIDWLENQQDSYIMTYHTMNDRNDDNIIFYKIIKDEKK